MLTLPECFGGKTQMLCIAGSYTFTLADPQEAVAVLGNTIDSMQNAPTTFRA